MSQDTTRVLLARRFLLGTGAYAPPASAATVTLIDTLVDMTADRDGVKPYRIEIDVYSSHDSGASGVVFTSTFDRGTNYRTQDTQTYLNADGPTTYDYLMKGGHMKCAYTNSANTLTAFEVEVFGIYDRNPGA